MKNRIKTTLKLTLICSLFFFLSCEKDLYEEQIIKQTKATSEKISINQVLSEISNPLIKDYINDVLQQELGLSQFRTSSQDYFNFIKIIKQDNYTTYSLLLNGYSDDKPYFKYFIITKEGITERAGYFKYIPDNEELVFNEKELNGKIQVLDVENNIKGETKFISSQPQPPLSTQSIDCVDTFDIITHNCTNGGNHPPGVPCGGGAINNGYYEIVVITTCTISSDYHYIAPPIDFMGVSSSTGGGYMLSQNINVLQYIFSLTEEQYSILQQCPSIVTYLENNDSSPESKILVTWALNSIIANINTTNFINEAFISLNDNGEVDFEHKIIIDKSLKDNPCLYGVYTQLGNAPTFQNYLQNFDGDFSVANLKLSADNNFQGNQLQENWDSQAITTTPENYLIKIIFNTDNTLPSSINHFPKIVTALTFVHEMIHAEIFRKLLTCSNLPNVNYTNMTNAQWVNHMNNLKNNFPGLYDYFVRYQVNSSSPTGFQHEAMAQHYRNIIKEALKQYDNNQHDDNFYETLSWFGLKNTTAWNNLSPTEKATINTNLQNIYQNEEYCN